MGDQFALTPQTTQGPTIEVSAQDPLKGGDVYGLAMEQPALLRTGRFDLLDISNVIDEIEDVGRSDYRALESKFEIVLLLILKWEYQPERRSRSWSNSIFEHRLQIERLLRQSPSLRVRQAIVIADAYADARRIASRQTGRPLSAFPETCPYSLSGLMSGAYEMDEL